MKKVLPRFTMLTEEEKMNRVANFMIGAFLGGLIGAVLALLFAPKSGVEFRQDITDYAEQIQTEIKQATLTKRKEMEAQLASLRSPKPTQ